jgi:hypothetical protein
MGTIARIDRMWVYVPETEQGIIQDWSIIQGYLIADEDAVDRLVQIANDHEIRTLH